MRPRAVFSSGIPLSSDSASRVPGTIPAAPAVGAATMMPILEFSSRTAIEYAMHLATSRPPAMSPSRLNSMTFRASPPTRPENDLPPASPRRTESFMMPHRSRNVSSTRGAGTPRSATSAARKISSSGRPVSAATASRSEKESSDMVMTSVGSRQLRDRRSARDPVEDVDSGHAGHALQGGDVLVGKRRVQVDPHERLVALPAAENLHGGDVDSPP